MNLWFSLCRRAAILWLAAGVAACLHSPAEADGEASLRILGASLFCGRTEPAALVTTAGNPAAYERLMAAFNLHGSKPPDFAEEIVILVALGQRPTLGYRILPAAERARVQNGVARIPVKVSQPPRDALVGQALTSPCLLLAVEREGVSAVRVEEQAGGLLGQVRVD